MAETILIALGFIWLAIAALAVVWWRACGWSQGVTPSPGRVTLTETLPARNSASEGQSTNLHRAYALLHLDQEEEAKEEFWRIRNLRPGHPGVLYGLACVAAGRGRYETAMAYLARAVAKEPGLARLAIEEPYLRPLRQDPRFLRILLGGVALPRGA